MLMTEMWQRSERSGNYYNPENLRANDSDSYEWERLGRLERLLGTPDGASLTPGGDSTVTADGACWGGRHGDPQGGIPSTSPLQRAKLTKEPTPTRCSYYDSPSGAKQHHQTLIRRYPSVDKKDLRVADASPIQLRSDSVPRVNGGASDHHCITEIPRINDSYQAEDHSADNLNNKRRELPQLSAISNHFDPGARDHTKYRFRIDSDESNSSPRRSSLRIEDLALSSKAQPLTYQEKDELYSRYENHKVEAYSYPRRYSSAMDDTPVMVHRYDRSRDYSQSRNYSSARFPPVGGRVVRGGGEEVVEQGPKDGQYTAENATATGAGYRHRYRPASPQSDKGGRGRSGRFLSAADSAAAAASFRAQTYAQEGKKNETHATGTRAGRNASSPVDPRPLQQQTSTTTPPSLHPLRLTSPGSNAPSNHIPRDGPLSSLPANESSQSSLASAADNSRPSSPPKARAALARSHVPKRHSTKDLCVICGDKASGYHYNTLSCEGCKGFFRRTITRSLHYQCKYGGNCVMDMWMRRKCPACRLKRCRQVGMREECLLTEHQCVIRNSRRRMKMKKKKEAETSNPLDQSKAAGHISPDDTQAILASLNSDHRDLIERLVNLQDKYELPSPEDLKLLREDKLYSAPNQEDLSDAIFLHMVEMTILVTRLIVEFAKNLPGFRNLVKEDQIVLLKSSSSEVMMLRTARRYNAETNTIVFGNGVPFSPNSMAFGGLQESVDSLFSFSKSMSGLYVDNAEYALLTAMCIFSVRSGLTNPSVVDKLQEVYMDVLLSYVSRRRSRCRNYLAKLLMKFVHLRTLGHEHSQTLYNLTLKKGTLPPLLTEYFDIAER